MTKITTLDSLAVVQVDLSIWTGQTKLHKEDINLGEGGSLPSEKVVQLGSKKIIDASRLKVFHSKRQAYRNKLMRVGIPFMNGYAVPVTKLDEVTQYLDDLEIEFNHEKHLFLNDYDIAVDQWALENPDMAQAIRSCAPSRNDVAERISFDYQVFKISPFTEDDERINRKIAGLGDELIAELINEAKSFYEKNLVGRDSLSTRTRSTLVGWYEKLEGLAFLSQNIRPLANLLKGAIDCYLYANGGQLASPYFWQVVGAVAILSDSSKVSDYLDGKISISSVGTEEESKSNTLKALHSNSSSAGSAPDLLEDVTSSVAPKTETAPKDKTEQVLVSIQDELQSLDDFFGDHSKYQEPSKPSPAVVESSEQSSLPAVETEEVPQKEATATEIGWTYF